MRFAKIFVLVALALTGCPKSTEGGGSAPPTAPAGIKIGLVSDVGGRGDQSFNDSALRGLETWAGGVAYSPSGYNPVVDADFQSSIPDDVKKVGALPHLGVTPLVFQAKSQEDYEPSLQLSVESGAQLTVGVGFMLEKSLHAVALRDANARFLLIDSPVLDEKNAPIVLPNVATITFREQEGSYLVGVLAALASKTGKVGFVGGMEMPLIKKFEAGFKAGVRATKPDAVILTAYTGSFDNPNAGKQTTQDLLGKGADVIFHAAGSDGLGVINAVKEARAAGKNVFAVGVDSDQSHLAPDAVLTSMVKHVDLAVYREIERVKQNGFKAGDEQWGLKEGGVGLAPIRVDLPGKDALLAAVEAARAKIIAGQIVVPATLAELDAKH
ncbi:MAG: BMP family ABC transporter substrate-binding protein [Deltaproteobacteria bacterium]|nr:BMP family ABC transporter substrate-binding protein [Deltaproteobacteria bacterium]